MFKKGRASYFGKYDGAITIRRDTTGKDYAYIRLDKSKWYLYHRYIWEFVHGKIPQGHVIMFIDGDTSNIHIDNLKMISLEEHAYIMHKSIPPEIVPTIILLKKIDRKLNKLTHKNN